ncbi:putative nucleolar protein C2C4.08 [Favolaschia claudopus]|uniref:Nucleolar protein C2C4.08 n=1 Tax=Favolaschia claudopus TaxID=2862362 RepID=A0AAW0D634_9AGAR
MLSLDSSTPVPEIILLTKLVVHFVLQSHFVEGTTEFPRPKSLQETEQKALQSVLAHEALVEPDSPLHIDGVNGLSLFLGMCHDGHQHLLFSSAQVDCVRFWLHAARLTANIIPPPNPEHQMTATEFFTLSAVTCPDVDSVRLALKQTSKNNKDSTKMARQASRAVLLRDALERVRQLLGAKFGTWLALDFEMWEQNHRLVTEFGYSALYWKNRAETTACGHLTVYGYERYRNGNHVPDNREHYQFGETTKLSKEAFQATIRNIIMTVRTWGPLFLVFHNPHEDIKILEQLRVPMGDATHTLPTEVLNEGVFIVDTATLFASLVREEKKSHGLKEVCERLGISTSYLHNAGNDAHYTLAALRAIAMADPSGMQGDPRWAYQ